MNIFAFRPFKGKFNLGDSADIPENEDGTLIGAVKEVKSALSDFKFRDNNGVAEYSIDGGTTWNKIGGGGMILDIANQKELKGKTSVSVSNKDGMIIGIYAYSGISNAIQAVNIDGVFAFNLPVSTHPESFEIPVHVNSSITFSGSVAPGGDYFAFIPAK